MDGKKRLKNSMLLLLQNTRLRLLCCNNAHVHVHSVTYSPAAQEVDKERPFLDRLLRHAELWCVKYELGCNGSRAKNTYT